MKAISNYFFIPILIFLISSCAAALKPNQSTVRPKDIKDLQLFETVSDLKIFDKKDGTLKADEITANRAKALLNKVIKSFDEKIPFKGEIIINQQNIKNQIETEIKNLFALLSSLPNIHGIAIPNVLDSLLLANGKRFALLASIDGFTGKKEKKIDLKEPDEKMLSTISSSGEALRTQSLLRIAILDSKNKNIAFFNQSILDNEDPLELSTLQKQITEIFTKYFW